MSMPLKEKLASLLVNAARTGNLDLRRATNLEADVRRLKSIRDKQKRLTAARSLTHKYPDHPQAHLALAESLHLLNDPSEFSQYRRYGQVLEQWLNKTGLGALGMEFIWPGIVMGSLGNYYALEALLQANRLGLRPSRKPMLLLPEGAQVRNTSLFSYFEPHLTVIRDREAIRALRDLEALMTLPLGYCLPMDGGCSFLDFPTNRVEVALTEQQGDKAFFSLTDEHRQRGAMTLREWGMPSDAWYVTIHVREPGYRGERGHSQDWRNANPLDYLDAIRLVVKEGGWVVRMGDPSMTPLPEMPQVIDYAHHPDRSDWMDVYLWATGRFLIGTASGPLAMPRLFGCPAIFTNSANSVPYYGLRSEDLYLPRLLRNRLDGSYLSFGQMLRPPTSMFSSPERFSQAGLEWVENTADELAAATQEMLRRTAGEGNASIREDETQNRFKLIAEACGKEYGGQSVKAFATVSREFVNRHADLLSTNEH